MHKYYSKIFFSKNSPKSFNSALVFPFLAIILSSMAIIVIFSSMNSLERKVINKIIGVTGYSRIYLDLDSNKDFEKQYSNIKEFLNTVDKKGFLSIEKTGIISHNNKEQIVRVIGISDFSVLYEKLGLKSDSFKNMKNKIVIGNDLAKYLGVNNSNNSKVVILAPIESEVFLRGLDFECVSENFEILNINAIDQISQTYVFVHYKDAKDLFSNFDSFLSINALLNNDEIQYINNNFSNAVYKEWKDFYPVFFSAMQIEKFLYTSFGAVLIFVASFNLYGLINLIIYRKRNQLSILVYLGVNLKELKQIFLNNILILGFLGSVIGVILSYLIIKTGLIEELIPMLDEIAIPFLIIPFSIIFNLITLYISSYFSINKNIKNIKVLKSNAITS